MTGFSIPNYNEASFPGQAEPDSRDFVALREGIDANGVLSGCAVTAGVGMAVTVAAGHIQLASVDTAITGGSVVLAAADPTLGRYDLIVAVNDDTVAAETGTAGAAPVFPPYDVATSVLLAAVFIPAGSSAIDVGQITDKRVTVVGSTTSDVGYFEANLTADARIATNASCAPGATDLTTATAFFVSTDVGKIVNLSTQRFCQDAAINATSTILTSATMAFTANDVGRVVHICGAGPGGVSLVTTITARANATTVTVAVAASTTVSGQVAGVAAQHRSTVTGFTDSSSVTIAGAPVPGFANVDLVVGTDQRAALATAFAAAAAAKKPLWLGTGDFLVELSSAHRWAVNTLVGTNAVVAAPSKQRTRFIVIYNGTTMGTATGGLFQVGGNTELVLRDFTTKYLGMASGFSGPLSTGAPMIAMHNGNGTTTNNVSLSNVDADTMAGAVGMQAGSSAPSRITCVDCQLVCTNEITWMFRDFPAASADHEHRLTRCVTRSLNQFVTMTDDNAFNCHLHYVHPTVVPIWDDTTLLNDQVSNRSTPYALHQFGSPTETPRIEAVLTNVRFEGTHTPVYTGAGSSIRYRFTNCHFESAVALHFAAVFVACRFVGAVLNAPAGTFTGEVADVIGCEFEPSATASSGVTISTVGMSWNIIGCRFVGSSLGLSTGLIVLAVNLGAITVRDCRFRGLTGNSQHVTHPAPGVLMVFDANYVTGSWAEAIIGNSTTGNDSGSLILTKNQFRQSSGSVIFAIVDIANGNVWGSDNFMADGALGPVVVAGGSAALVPPRRRSPTALVVGSNTITPGWNYDQYTVTGVATINTILAGGVGATAGTNRARGGDLYLTAGTGAVTLAHGTGNIGLNGAVNRVLAVGDSVHLRANERAGTWSEV